MAQHCAHCGGTDLSPMTQTAVCFTCGQQTHSDGTPAEETNASKKELD